MASHANAATVCFDDFPRDGQAQADAAFGLARHAKKTVEDAVLEFFRYAGYLIADTELDAFFVHSRRAQGDFAIGRRMFDGVGDEVSEDVIDSLAIHQDGGQI